MLASVCRPMRDYALVKKWGEKEKRKELSTMILWKDLGQRIVRGKIANKGNRIRRIVGRAGKRTRTLEDARGHDNGVRPFVR